MKIKKKEEIILSCKHMKQLLLTGCNLQSCILHELHFRYRFLNSIVEVLVEKGGRIG